MDAKTVLDITGLSYIYTGATPALDSINLKVAAGEKLAIIGPNGAGKSTLLLHINGILRGTGSITVNGILLTKSSIREIRRMVGFVFQNPDDQLFSHTVYEDIAFGPSQYKHSAEEIQERVSDALDSAGIPGFENRSPFKMSFGEQKLVSLATALVLKPKILALDEPSSNLDPKHRRRLINFLKNYERTAILTTHDLDFAAEVCDRCVILFKGKIADDGPSEKILTDKNLLEQYDLELPMGTYF